MPSSWVNTSAGVPKTGAFGSTRGQGTPLVIDNTTNIGYYLDKGVVKPLAGSGGTQTDPVPPLTDDETWAVIAAHAGMAIDTPRAFTLGAGWQTVANYNASTIPAVRASVNLASGGLSSSRAGVFTVRINMALTMASANGGRHFFMRLYNLNDGAPVGSNTLRLDVGRDTDGFNFSCAYLVSLTGANKSVAIQLGNGDTFNNTQIADARFDISRTG